MSQNKNPNLPKISNNPISYDPKNPWTSYPEFKEKADILFSHYGSIAEARKCKIVLKVAGDFHPGFRLVARGKNRRLDGETLMKLWEFFCSRMAESGASKKYGNLTKKEINFRKIANEAQRDANFAALKLKPETLRKALSEIFDAAKDPQPRHLDGPHVAILRAYIEHSKSGFGEFHLDEFIEYYCDSEISKSNDLIYEALVTKIHD